MKTKLARLARILAVNTVLISLILLCSTFRRTPIGIGFIVPRALAQNTIQLNCPTIPNVQVITALTIRTSVGLFNWGCYDSITGNLYIGNTAYLGPSLNSWQSAMTALPSGGGIINDEGASATSIGSLTISKQLWAKLGAANYTFTGITANIGFVFQGLNNATFMQYTGPTGTCSSATPTACAVNLALINATNAKGSGFRDLRMYGPGSGTSTTGLLFNDNTSTAPVGAYLFSNFELDSFGTGITCASGASGLGFSTFLHSGIFGNGQNVLIASGCTGERLEFIDSDINNLTTFSSTWSGCFTDNAAGVNIRIIGGAVDYCQLVVTNGFVELGDATYVEDTNIVAGTCTTASVSGCPISVSGSGIVLANALLSLFAGSNASFMGVTSNGQLIVQGGTFTATAGSSGAPISCVTGNGYLSLNPAPILAGSGPYTSYYAGGCLSLSGSANATPNNALGIPAVAILGGNGADAGIIRTNSAAGANTWITDINAGSGSFAGSAGDLYWYGNGSNQLEIGPTVGGAKTARYNTTSNCAVNSVSPAACGSASSGVFAVPTTTVTYTINTTQVTANSRIFVDDITDNTGIPSSPTCTALASFANAQVTSRVAGTSFTISLPSTAGTTCFNYFIFN